ncbi:MAG: apolipoprotein N-acyltransferase [Ignavibacteria bacterium]|nr:apolipoprotein N-acyltransferase [Ignavibacteria bacterium]
MSFKKISQKFTKNFLRELILLIVTGFCLGFSFPPFNISFLLIIGYALLIHIIQNTENYKKLFLRAGFVFFVFDLIALSWISLAGVRTDADKFLILGGFFTIVLHCITLLIPVYAFYFISNQFNKIKHKNISLLFFPIIFTAYEFLMSITEVSFPWLISGNAFSNSLEKIQYADITGVYGVSLWALTLSALFYYIFLSLKKTIKSLQCSNSENKKHFAPSIITAIIFTFLLVVPNLYTILSAKRYLYSKNELTDTLKIGVIQPNIDPWEKWGMRHNELMKKYSDLILSLYNQDKNIQLVVLPETAVTFYILHPAYRKEYSVIKNISDSLKLPILLGFPDFYIYKDSSNNFPSKKPRIDSKESADKTYYYDVFNSAVLIDTTSNTDFLQRYNKIKLVIGSERMPYQEKLTFLKDIIRWGVGLSSYQTGQDTTVFNVYNKFRFNVAICYESIYPEFFSKFVNKGAQFSIVITNDGWWGKLQGTYQHNQFAIFRAIENRRWIVRCANTGISGTIDPYGNYYHKTSINQEALFIANIGLREEKTFYTLYGDWLPRICCYLTVIILFVGLGIKISSKKFSV